jgi:hypothetical protein
MTSFALNQFIPLPLPHSLHPRHIHNQHSLSHAARTTIGVKLRKIDGCQEWANQW